MREQILNQKQEVVSEIKEKFEASASAVVVEYRGLSVKDITTLRRQLHEEGVDFKVYKNTMTRRAVEAVGLEDLLDVLVGPNAIAFSEDAIAPSRVLSKFAKKNKKLVIKKGMVEGKVVDEAKLKELSDLPNKEGMLAMLLGALQSPLRDFAWAIKQVSELDDREAGEPAEVQEAVEAAVETTEVVVESVVEETVEEPVEETVGAVDVAEETVEETVEAVEVAEDTEETVEAVEAAEVVEDVVEELETQPEDEEATSPEVVEEEVEGVEEPAQVEESKEEE